MALAPEKQTDSIKKLHPLWEKRNDRVGVVPTFPVLCPICKSSRGVDSEMVMRRSNIHRVADIRMRYGTQQHRPYAFDVAYKCPQCALYIVFGVAVDEAYAQKVIKLRGGTREYVLPEEIWEADPDVIEKMKAFGYWGGQVGDVEPEGDAQW